MGGEEAAGELGREIERKWGRARNGERGEEGGRRGGVGGGGRRRWFFLFSFFTFLAEAFFPGAAGARFVTRAALPLRSALCCDR